MGRIKVIAESAGNVPLERIFEASELENKTIKNILAKMVLENYEGKDMTACDAVKIEMESAGGYGVANKIGGNETQIVYDPIKLTDPIRKYEEDTGEEMPVVRIAVNGLQEAGYKK